jgi:serine/threonine-protein kinase
MWAHLSEPPPRLSEVAPQAPAALDEVIKRALAKDPAGRYQSAGDLGRAAEAALTGAPAEHDDRIVAVGAAAPIEVETRTAGTMLPTLPAPPHRTGHARSIAAVAVLVAVALAVVVVILALRKPAADQPASTRTPPPTQTPKPRPGVDSVRVGGRLNNIIAAGGRIWVGAFLRPTLTAVDPKDVRKLSRPNADIGVGLSGSALSGHTMWVIVARDQHLLRLDARSGRAIGAPIALPGIANAVAVAGNTVWVALSQPSVHSGDLLVGFDATTGARTHTLNVLNGVCRLLVAHGALWLLSSNPARLARIDQRTGKRRRMRLGAGAAGDLATGDGFVWATLVDADQLVRIDPDTWNVTTIATGREPNGIVAASGSIWVANRVSSTLSRVDPRAGRVREEIKVPLNPYELAADTNGVWVTSLATGRVSRVTDRARAG